MENMKITFSDDQRDFAPWMREKCGNVLFALCRMLQYSPDISENAYFQWALEDALKIHALCCEDLDRINCELVYSLLVKYNTGGYDYLNDLISGTKNSSIMHEIMQYERDEEILVLIEQNEKTNRTKIEEILVQSIYSNRWMEEIKSDIELVHMGNQSWEWFYEKHCNDRNTFYPQFKDDLIREVYEHFRGDSEEK